MFRFFYIKNNALKACFW